MPRNSDAKYMLAASYSRKAAEQLDLPRSAIDKILIEAMNANRIRLRARMIDAIGNREDIWRYRRAMEASHLPKRQHFQNLFMDWAVFPVLLPAERMVKKAGLADESSNIFLRCPKTRKFQRVLLSAELLLSDCDKVLSDKINWPGVRSFFGKPAAVDAWCDLAVLIADLDRRGWFKNGSADALKKMISDLSIDLDPRSTTEITERVVARMALSRSRAHSVR